MVISCENNEHHRKKIRNMQFASFFFLVVSSSRARGDVKRRVAALVERVALVVGHGAYKHLQTLRNSCNDARDLRAFVVDHDFEVVFVLDGTAAQLKEHIKQFNKMLVKSKSTTIADSKALEEVKPELEKLKYKVCSRTRNYLISKMNNLRKPKSNFQIYQESVLLKYKNRR